jgi:hypothetical protein
MESVAEGHEDAEVKPFASDEELDSVVEEALAETRRMTSIEQQPRWCPEGKTGRRSCFGEPIKVFECSSHPR